VTYTPAVRRRGRSRPQNGDSRHDNIDEIGPVDYLVVGFPAEQANFSGEMASELKALIDSNTSACWTW